LCQPGRGTLILGQLVESFVSMKERESAQ